MCFSIGWFVQLLIVLVVLSAVIALVRLWVLPLLATADARIPQTINILIWVAVAIFVIYVVADLLTCALGGGLGLTHSRY